MNRRVPKIRRLKPVVTLDWDSLKSDMQRLWEAATAAGNRPDGIVGIASGGLICTSLLEGRVDAHFFSCSLQRPGTQKKKKSLFVRYLRLLPYAMTNWMRRFEDVLLERRAHGEGTMNPPLSDQLRHDVEVIATAVAERSLRSLLVVDDAVDSGATLEQVVAALQAALPKETRIETAVITQTRHNPRFAPDLRLYEMTLCRFPWSFDYRGAA